MGTVVELTRLGDKVRAVSERQNRQDRDHEAVVARLEALAVDIRGELRGIRNWLIGLLSSGMLATLGLFAAHVLKTT